VCATFTAEREALLAGQRSDQVVAADYVAIFLSRTTPLMDAAAAAAANATFQVPPLTRHLNFFDSAQCLMVRRWRLIGHFPILYNP
jgi:hypothetical protein